MKKIYLVASLLLMGVGAMAQLSGKIVYEEKITIDFGDKLEGIPEAQREQVMAMLEKMKVRKSKKELLFSSEASIFQKYEATEGEANVDVEEGNVRMQMIVENPDQKVFKNFKTNDMVEKSEFMGKTFLIRDETKSLPWKINKETREIAGYNCQQAVMISEDNDTITAWFTKQIPVPSGPMTFGQLPGVILGMTLQDGMFEYTALSVNMGEIDKEKFKIPTKGKKVTREQYNAIVKEKTSEMEKFEGGNGMHMEIRMGR